jgi:hypothetical protein
LNAFIPLLSEIGLVTLKRLGRLRLANAGLAQIQLLQAKGCGLASKRLLGC